MPFKRTICCCKALTWTRVFAWIQIAVYGLFSIGSIVALAFLDEMLGELKNEDKDVPAELTIFFIVVVVLPLLGLTMSILLLIGTLQKRVCLLRAWLIFACLSLASALAALAVEDTHGKGGIDLFQRTVSEMSNVKISQST